MRNLFNGYYALKEGDYTDLWKNGVFIPDANILLNIYRYPTSARDELLSVFRKLGPRLWLPYQAALEYQRNRTSVIADQKRRFSEVRSLVSGAASKLETEFSKLQLRDRHSLIDPDPFLNKLKPLVASFQDELAALEANQINVHDDDKLRSEIDQIFDGKVGPKPTFDFIKSLETEAIQRFSNKIPPGYMDDRKSEGPNAIFSYGGIKYDAKYGDLILWKQIIEYAKESDASGIVFLTDDEKDDWWMHVNSDGNKRIGPRPELVEEILRESGTRLFHMYNSFQFLTYAKLNLEADVSDKSIEVVREATAHPPAPKDSPAPRAVRERPRYTDYGRIRAADPAWEVSESDVHYSVYTWLQSEYTGQLVAYSADEWADFVIVESGTATVGVVVLIVRRPSALITRLREALYQALHAVNKSDYPKAEVITVFENPRDIVRIERFLTEGRITIPENVMLSSGFFAEGDFVPALRIPGPA